MELANLPTIKHTRSPRSTRVKTTKIEPAHLADDTERRELLWKLLMLPNDDLLQHVLSPRSCDRWPRTVVEAVDTIISAMPLEDKIRVKNTPRHLLTFVFHHGWGTGIRNDFGLWRGNLELLESCRRFDPDSASGVIMEAVWDRLQGE